MNEIFHFGKILIVIGLILAAVGLLLMLGGKIPWIGRLPGDFLIKGKHFTFYFPLATSILVSIILSLILYLFFRSK
jgi:membrane protein implicated in regulation of membrane protease activity